MRKFDLSLRSSRSSYFATFRHQLTILSKTDALDEEKWLNMLGTFVKRSEERRVGKECRSRWSRHHQKKNDNPFYPDVRHDDKRRHAERLRIYVNSAIQDNVLLLC